MKLRHAFTLVEMLVVLCILGLLSSLGFSLVRRSLESGRRMQCLGNVRQIGMATQMYVADHEGRLPHTSHSLAGGESQSWIRTLGTYLGPDFIGRCPSNPTSRAAVSYAWNDVLTESAAGQGGVGIRVSLLTDPSQTLALAEHADGYLAEHFHFAGTKGGPQRISANAFRASVGVERHGDSANYLFADGRAACLPWTEVQRRLRRSQSKFLVP
jgi:prepilin-type processing-associated H-X9-DG protein/prepilin-type N-terminal cleavage/methylation domain-containing protein